MPGETFIQQYRGELTIIALGVLIFLCLLILVPQLLRAQQKSLELAHQEQMRALEQGMPLARRDDRAVFAGRTALLVPIFSICTAGTVTCFVVVYRSDISFGVSLAVWLVCGIVSLAAITAGFNLFVRLSPSQNEQNAPEPPVEK
jgi:hypothetical protein